MRTLLIALAGLLWLGCLCCDGQEPARPTILFIGSYGGGCNYEVARRLDAAGLALRAGSGLTGRALSWDEARQYHAIVSVGLGQANADGTLPETVTTTLQTLRRFLDEGGGILLLLNFGQMAAEAPPQEAFLQPLGLTPLFAETPTDTDTTVSTAWRVPFAYTDAIPAGPLTEGVGGLWYPVPTARIGAQNHTTSFVADENWTVVVEGGPTTATHRRGSLNDNTVDPKAPGTYTGRMPLVATRTVGRGRLMVVGVTAEYLIGAHAFTTLEGIVLERGLRDRPSGGYRLLENGLRWLTAPALENTALGGAAGDPGLLADPHQAAVGTPYAWPAELSFPAVEPAYPGVIGARTSYSSGRATPAEWVAAAQAQGLSFLVFLEDFTSLSAEEFNQLRADCERLSSPEFAALPGFTIDDEVGNHYFYFGPAIPYPEASFLSPDGTVLQARDRELNPTDPHIPGQLAMTTLDYAYTTCAFKLTAGNFLFSQDAAPFADFFSDWNAMAVVTARDGQLLEDATEDYLRLVDSGQGPLPLALHLMSDPAQLAASPWRTVLRLPAAGGNVVAGTLRAESKLRDYFSLWHFYPDNPSKISVTSGPQIESWAYVGPRDYEGSSPGDFVWQNYRWVLRGRVTSTVGLREVVVYDGPRVFRRYRPAPAPDDRVFEFTLDLTHDQQHNLVIVATDVQGGKAVSGEQWDRNHRAEEFMCSDRNNQLSYGYTIREDGTWLMTGGNQPLATPSKRVANSNISPSGTFRNDPRLGAPAFDGAAGGEPEVFASVLPEGTPEPVQVPDVSESVRLMHSGDVHIGESRRAHSFSDGIMVHNVWHTLWRTTPARDYTVTQRNHFFQIDPESPLAVFLWQLDFQLRRDLPSQSFHVGHMTPGEAQLWVYRDSAGGVRAGNWEVSPRSAERYLTADLGPGSYAAFLDSPLGGAAVFPLTEGLQVIAPLPQRSRCEFVLDPRRAPQRQGDRGRVELLLVGIPRLTDLTRQLPAASTEVVERFYRDFGLDGGPPGYSAELTAGTITGQRYILAVDGTAEQCLSGRLTGSLVSSLPITVSGLHDHWSAYLYDRQRKQARPLGMFEGQAWATVCLRGALDLFVGHPVIATNPELTLQVTQIGDDTWRVEVHNPTAAAITATLQANPRFDPLAAKGLAPEELTVPPGSSVWREW